MAASGEVVRIRAWRPGVQGIAEVFHAKFAGHAYPPHTHNTWTLLIVDSGAVEFMLDRRRHFVDLVSTVLLPPGVSHDGRAAAPSGFRKRVLYLDADLVPERLIGSTVDRPLLPGRSLRRDVHALHDALTRPGDELEAESLLALVGDRLRRRLGADGPCGEHGGEQRAARLAVELRDLLDSRMPEGITLRRAGELLHADPAHLVRCFKGTFGLPPHQYLTGRRIDRARRLLILGAHPADIAAEVGFYDQAHLTRHFKRHFGTTPARFAARSSPSGEMVRPQV